MNYRLKVLPQEMKRVLTFNRDAIGLYLNDLRKARPTTPRSWLYEDRDAEEVLEEWISILSRLDTDDSYSKKVFQFDLKQREKFGPQGGHPALKDALKQAKVDEQYAASTVVDIDLPPLHECIHIPRHSIEYRELNAVIDDMRSRDTLTTNSGWPDFTKREKVVKESKRDAKNGRAWSYPALPLFRHYNGKVRLVWMYPASMNLLEFQATQPLQQAMQAATRYVTPWKGFEAVKKRFTELWQMHPCAFGGDTTQMDAHMKMPQLYAVGECIAPLFKDSALAERTLYHVGEIPLVVSTTQWISGEDHGIASGSGWTQLSETIFQIAMFQQFINENDLPLTPEDGMGIGDDYVWFFDESPDSEKIVNFWEERGLPGKPEKQSNEPDSCTFLQRLFIKGYFSRDDSTVLGGIYPTIRALNSLLHPEKFHKPNLWSSDMFCIRVYQILENCVDHPLFEEFVKFVVAGHKDLIPFAKKSASQLNRLQAEARAKLPGLVPTYNQEKRDKPLSEYDAVKVAAQL